MEVRKEKIAPANDRAMMTLSPEGMPSSIAPSPAAESRNMPDPTSRKPRAAIKWVHMFTGNTKVAKFYFSSLTSSEASSVVL